MIKIKKQKCNVVIYNLLASTPKMRGFRTHSLTPFGLQLAKKFFVIFFEKIKNKQEVALPHATTSHQITYFEQ